MLLSVPGKVLASINLERIRIHKQRHQTTASSVQTKTIMLRTEIHLTQIIEKATGTDATLILNFIDFKKAFDGTLSTGVRYP